MFTNLSKWKDIILLLRRVLRLARRATSILSKRDLPRPKGKEDVPRANLPASLDQISMFVGVQVRKLRRLHGISRQELAKASDISMPTLSRIESGQRSLSLRTLGNLAKGLHVSLGQLMDSRIAPTEHVPRSSSNPCKGQTYRTARLSLNTRRVYLEADPHQNDHFTSKGPTLVHLIRGECVYRYGANSQRLSAGDSLLVHSRTRHGVHKALKLPLELVFIATAARSAKGFPGVFL